MSLFKKDKAAAAATAASEVKEPLAERIGRQRGGEKTVIDFSAKIAEKQALERAEFMARIKDMPAFLIVPSVFITDKIAVETARLEKDATAGVTELRAKTAPYDEATSFNPNRQNKEEIAFVERFNLVKGKINTLSEVVLAVREAGNAPRYVQVSDLAKYTDKAVYPYLAIVLGDSKIRSTQFPQFTSSDPRVLISFMKHDVSFEVVKA